jgi:glycosyltransferase involved in cell wall biosynthesis
MRVPPVTHGGTKRIVSLLTEELVRRGHEVTLFATADAQTQQTCGPFTRGTLQPPGRVVTWAGFDYYRISNLSDAIRDSGSFDVIHCHIGPFSIPFGGLSGTRFCIR